MHSYTLKIKEFLDTKNLEKYEHLKPIAIDRHLKHIEQCIARVIQTGNDDLLTPYIELKHAFPKRVYFPEVRQRYQNARMKELAERIHHDNVMDKLCIVFWNNDLPPTQAVQ